MRQSLNFDLFKNMRCYYNKHTIEKINKNSSDVTLHSRAQQTSHDATKLQQITLCYGANSDEANIPLLIWRVLQETIKISVVFSEINRFVFVFDNLVQMETSSVVI